MKRILLPIICSFALLLNVSLTQAATISPSTIELTAGRGDVVESSIEILNTGASEQTYFLDVLSFEPSDESGAPQFTPKESDPSGLVSWINVPVSEIKVPAQTKVEVPFLVAVPDDVSSGGYYAALTVSTTPSDVVATNGAVINAKTAILVLLTVEGETNEQLALLDFSLTQDRSSLPFGTFFYRVQNQGNVHSVPYGEIRLTGVFGQSIGVFDANPSEGRVLPGSTRTYELAFGPGELRWMEVAGYQLRYLAFGPVSAELSLEYGESGMMQAQQTLWLVPWELISVLGVALLILLVWRHSSKKK